MGTDLTGAFFQTVRNNRIGDGALRFLFFATEPVIFVNELN
jgi:hypothetical protein